MRPDQEKMILNGMNIARAIELANALRGAFDEDLIEDLPMGQPGSPHSCILARAFNFDCAVIPAPYTEGAEWMAKFPVDKGAQARLLADEIGTYVVFEEDGRYRVSFPPEVGLIAQAFDHNLLPQYDERQK